MSMRSIRLNSRTTLCFGVVCLLLLIQGGMTLVKVDKVYSSTVEIETNWLPSIRQAGKMESSLLKLRLELRRFALDDNRLSSTSVGAVKEAETTLVKMTDDYAQYISSPE
ncbi:methyl-accepting chemotaxis protein, partial [Pseudomonas gessardii]|nr:methyl-accepting chemotaxis protein [Pseudomonas gessardii]